ncbi:MAG: PaaI family thioesterase [Terricaulis sp.]
MTNTPPPAGYQTGESTLERALTMSNYTPQAQALGMEITRVEAPKVWGRVRYRADLVGDPDTGVIAGGVITTLLDQVCGVAAVSAMKAPFPVATIDLRIDYMRPAIPGRDVVAEAHCYKLGKSVAFVRAVAYEDSNDNPIAQASGAFMINAARPSKKS